MTLPLTGVTLFALEIESGASASTFDILRRTNMVRTSVTSIRHGDVRKTPPVAHGVQQYDVVASNFCAECVTQNSEQWGVFVANIASLVAPGGIFLTTAVRKANGYSVGPVLFPAASIDEADLAAVLRESGFSAQQIVIRSVPADRASRHYEGLMLASAVKRNL